jgi:hypothetical protein
LLVTLARLELTLDFLAVDGIAPLLAARAAVQYEIRGDLVPVAILAGGKKGEQITA